MLSKNFVEYKGIGCCCWVPKYQEGIKVLAIDCAKGRGIILPGGKFERGTDKTFADAARRELLEETGVKAGFMSLLFQGMSPDNYYIYCFLVHTYNDAKMLESTPEGKPMWVDDLKSELFEPFYHMCRMQLGPMYK